MDALELELEQKHVMSQRDFARLGDGYVAYVREITAEQAAQMVGDMPHLLGHARLYALHGADGRCLTIAETKNAALADAWEKDLHPLYVH